MNFTPGPWAPACKTNSATVRHPAILCNGGQVAIATFQGSEQATDANARLIAAAPELMNIVLWLIQEYEEGDGNIPDGLYNAAKNAVKKVTA